MPLLKPLSWEIHETKLSTRADLPPAIDSAKWYLGVRSNVQISALENPTTQLGMNGQSRITNKLSYGITYAFDLGYRLNPKSNLEFSLILNNKKTQRYNDFYLGKYIEKSISLNYQSISIKYGRNLLPYSGISKSHLNLSLGLFGSYLYDVVELRNEEHFSWLSDGFLKFDVGANIGVNYSYSLFKSVHLNTGLYYANGVINIFKGIHRMPSNFFKTYTSSLGASLGVQYCF